MTTTPYLTFSQRNGLQPILPQLEFGEVSPNLRRHLQLAVKRYLERCIASNNHNPYLESASFSLFEDLEVFIFKQRPSLCAPNAYGKISDFVSLIDVADLVPLFDFIEFLISHKNADLELRTEVSCAFIQARAAYRVVDDTMIVAIGSEEQGAAYLRAIDDTINQPFSGARKHLIQAGTALRNGDWCGSIRESIHAVESVCVILAPEGKALSIALDKLSDKAKIHKAMRTGFKSLYGYTSDEEGIRHCLLDKESNVDETDALFMLGACASFVSYLIARSPSITLLNTATTVRQP